MKNRINPNLTLTLHYIFKILHPVGGIIAIYLGYRLFVRGVTGQASLSVNSKAISGQLLNAAPGLVVIVGGLITICVSAWRGDPIGSTTSGNKAVFFANDAATNDPTDPEKE